MSPKENSKDLAHGFRLCLECRKSLTTFTFKFFAPKHLINHLLCFTTSVQPLFTTEKYVRICNGMKLDAKMDTQRKPLAKLVKQIL